MDIENEPLSLQAISLIILQYTIAEKDCIIIFEVVVSHVFQIPLKMRISVLLTIENSGSCSVTGSQNHNARYNGALE